LRIVIALLDLREVDMDRRIIELYDEYAHAPLERRVFLDRLAALAGGTAAAALLLPLLEIGRAEAAVVSPDDPRIAAASVSYPGKSGAVQGYLAKPASGSGFGAVLVIHENRGLNAHIEDVARRLAVAGFVALAPDLLSIAGGTPADEDKARDMIQKLDRPTAVADAVAGVAWLRQQQEATGPGANHKVGAVGFCWGGGMVNQLAVADPTLDAAVVYYGAQPDPADAAKIRAPMMLHYGGLDERIDAGIPAFRAALDKAGVSYEIYVYEGANHAFNNDTSPARYDANAAKLAWDRTIAFFTAKLKPA
jgi:carboxymethylenebutenolidase